MLKAANVGQVFYVPGEHDVLGDNGRQYLERYGKGTKGSGWFSFDHKGVHFIGLVNVVDLKAGGLGNLGADQLEWLERGPQRPLPSSTPIVVFAHIPLWSVYPEWGWGTDDGAQALSYLKKFGSVTVLNGHIHQTMQKVEGHVTFHTATSTAFPQPAPGSGGVAGTDDRASRTAPQPARPFGSHIRSSVSRACDRRSDPGTGGDAMKMKIPMWSGMLLTIALTLTASHLAAGAGRRRSRRRARRPGDRDRQLQVQPGDARDPGRHEGDVDQPR